MVRCNHKGGYGIRVKDGAGRLVRYRLRYGENDIDPDLVRMALDGMAPEMAKALTAGDLPCIELPVLGAAAETGDMGVVDKAKVVRACTSLTELRDLAEGEERKTVLNAIDRRAMELTDEED